MKEILKDIPGYEGVYMVSNLGYIKSYDRIRPGYNYKSDSVVNRSYVGSIMKASVMRTYLGVRLMKEGKYKTMLIHRAVALAFIDNPENKLYVNHIDFNPLNNCVNNLEWCTAYENIHHTINHGRSRQLFGEDNGQAKLKNIQIKEIFDLYNGGMSQYEIARKYNIHQSSISKIITGKIYNKIPHD